jgi:hypothetical protein
MVTRLRPFIRIDIVLRAGFRQATPPREECTAVVSCSSVRQCHLLILSLYAEASRLCESESEPVPAAMGIRGLAFLTLTQEGQERDLERGLLARLRQFLELGVGFAFVGGQVPLDVGGEDFKIEASPLKSPA